MNLKLDYPVLYAIARNGKVFEELPKVELEQLESLQGSVKPLLDSIVKYIPSTVGDSNAPLQMQICSLEFDNFNGRYLIGKVSRGTIKTGQSVAVVDSNKEVSTKGTIKKLMIRNGLKFEEVTSAPLGEIIGIIGLDSTAIGSTVCDVSNLDPLPSLKISPPSIEVIIEPNTSPLVGQDGKFVTARLLKKRLDKEKEQNISLNITTSEGGTNSVFVRGELQLTILIETLRREGFEFQIRKPKIVTKTENGILLEPIEELSIEVPEEFSSIIVQELSLRNAELVDMQNTGNKVTFDYKILTRKLMGLRNFLNTQTKGNLVFNSSFLEYTPHKELKEPPRRGMLVSMESGETREYSLNTIQERGDLFVSGSEHVYEGMIIGLNKFEEEMEVNPVKERKKSGVRVHHAMITLTDLKTPMRLTIESALEIMTDEELLEITPNNIRLRKLYLTKTQRDWSKRTNLTDYARKQLGMKE
jgi:GTP-binding protein